ncbi:MAG: VOC family protein [Spirulinaceae cyanobacterium]
MATPRINLLVLRVRDLNKAVAFYQAIGLTFTPEQHGSGPVHYSAEIEGVVLELYPLTAKTQSTAGIRLGFTVQSLDQCLVELNRLGAMILTQPHNSPWGKRAVVQDEAGHILELIEANA